MKTKTENQKRFSGILADHKTVKDSFHSAGMKVRIIWQFGEPVEVEEPVIAAKESGDDVDFSLPIVNAVLNPRDFFLQ